MSHNVDGTGCFFLREVDFKVNGHMHVIYFHLNTPPPKPFADAYLTDVDLLCIMYTFIFI